jgi:segregation and condensation protein A
MGYEVQTAVFEGPFDLLLHLILREQVDLYEVSLSTIVDAYLAELTRFEELDLEIATEFLLIAATLVELKTRRLLPDDDDGELDDELALWEERDLLLSRLLECKTFKDAARALSRLSDEAGRSWPRTAGVEDRFIDLAPDLLTGVTPLQLRDAYLKATAPKPVPRVDIEHVASLRLSVTEAVVELADELRRAKHITFRQLTSSLVERLEVVVRFLALLELFKQGLIDLDQPAKFGDIDILWLGGVPEGDDDERGAFDVMADLAAVNAYDG